MAQKIRCPWAASDPLYIRYHDQEWGIPLYDDRKLFELLILETMQAGLSWITILKKRPHFYQAFDHFDPEKIACYREDKLHSLLNNSAIIRNKLKITATVQNAQSYLNILNTKKSFSNFIWNFFDGRPLQNSWNSLQEVPTFTDTSIQMSKELQKQGFKFVGKTICYAFMQAAGLVNDHMTDCFRHKEIMQHSEIPANLC